MGAEAETAQTIVLSFLGLLVMGWLLFAVLRMMRRSGYEVETLAFFLSTASALPSSPRIIPPISQSSSSACSAAS